jgi:hypothetical protein
LFAKARSAACPSLSTLGLVLFMFIVGAELRAPDGVRSQVEAAGWVGVLGVLCRWARAWRSRPCCIARDLRRGVLAVRVVHGGGVVESRVP